MNTRVTTLVGDLSGTTTLAQTVPARATDGHEGYQGWHCWRGSFHPVPSNFRVHTYCAKDHWNLWHGGNVSANIYPHKLIVNKRDLCKEDRPMQSKIRTVMNILLQYALEADPPMVVRHDNMDEVFQYSYGKLMERLYPGGTRRSCNDILVSTLYENHMQLKKRA
jgi:hypothetical protein